MAPLKYTSNFWRTLEIPLINCEIYLILTRSQNCVTASRTAINNVITFAITDTELYLPNVTHGNAKLSQQLKSRFKGTINWNKYQSKPIIQARNQFLDYLIDQSFQEVNRLIILSLENNAHQTIQKRYFVATVEIKDYNLMIDRKNLFDQTLKNVMRT